MNLARWLESDFFVHLAQCLGHFLWQGLLIAVLATMAAWLLRRGSAQSRYLVYLTALLAMGACLPSTFVLLRAAGSAATANVSPDQLLAAAPSIANTLGVDSDHVNVKAKTNEGVGPVGLANAIACTTVVLLMKL